MFESLRYIKGLGNNAVYARIVNGAQFWDFVALAWVGAETANCRVYLSELTDTSDSQSWYQGTFADPSFGGPYPVEIVNDGAVIGNDITSVAYTASSGPAGALTGKQILDDAMSIIQSGGAVVRSKMLGWLNVVATMLATERPWVFLSNGVATITPVSNSLPLPADFGEFKYIQAPNAFYFDQRGRLTPGEAQAADNALTGYCYPRGFTQDNANIYLHSAGFTSPVTLGYTISPSGINDDTSPTCWPWQCRAFFMKACLDFFYEFDMDERKATSWQMENAELLRLKRWDNNQKPKTQNNRHGYRRTR